MYVLLQGKHFKKGYWIEKNKTTLASPLPPCTQRRACLTLNINGTASHPHASCSGDREAGAPHASSPPHQEGQGWNTSAAWEESVKWVGREAWPRGPFRRWLAPPADTHYHSHMAFEYSGSFRAHGNRAALWGIWQWEERSNTRTHTHTYTHTCVSHLLYRACAVWIGGQCTEFLEPHWLTRAPETPVSIQVGGYSEPWLNSTNEICGLDELC